MRFNHIQLDWLESKAKHYIDKCRDEKVDDLNESDTLFFEDLLEVIQAYKEELRDAE